MENDLNEKKKSGKGYLVLSIIFAFIALGTMISLLGIGFLVMLFGPAIGAKEINISDVLKLAFNGYLCVFYIIFLISAIVFWKKYKKSKGE